MNWGFPVLMARAFDEQLKLGYKNPSNALQVHVDSDDKTSYLIQVSGSIYKANTLFVNESGLYSLILASKLPQAKAFKRWVTAEVLPQIRKTGGNLADNQQWLAKELGVEPDGVCKDSVLFHY